MKYFTENKNWNIVKDYNVDKMLYLLIDRPDYFTSFYFYWKNNKNQWHRNYDLPAAIWKNGYFIWYKSGSFIDGIQNEQQQF